MAYDFELVPRAARFAASGLRSFWLSSAGHSAMTGAKAKASTKVAGRLFGLVLHRRPQSGLVSRPAHRPGDSVASEFAGRRSGLDDRRRVDAAEGRGPSSVVEARRRTGRRRPRMRRAAGATINYFEPMKAYFAHRGGLRQQGGAEEGEPDAKPDRRAAVAALTLACGAADESVLHGLLTFRPLLWGSRAGSHRPPIISFLPAARSGR